MITVGKSDGLKDVDCDAVFDAVDKSIGQASMIFSDAGKEILASMKCKKCGGDIKYSGEHWGCDNKTISWDGLRCRDCGKERGLTGFDAYNAQTKERIPWLTRTILCFLTLMDY